MTQYKGDFPFPVLFPPGSPKNVLAEALANEKIKQYHCAGLYCFVWFLSLYYYKDCCSYFKRKFVKN